MLPAALWSRLIDILDDAFSFTPDAEVTVEANPSSISAGHVKLWKDWRVSRVSLGVQSLIDSELRFLGRAHDSAQALKAGALCKNAGLSLSLDLIFGLPGSPLRNWAWNLSRAAGVEPDHLSIYQLSIEEGTPFALKNFQLPDGYEQYRYAQWYLPRKGYEQYEVASFAKPGRESGHNLNYWADGDYIGLGPSAWSCVRGVRFKNAPSLGEYARLIGERRSAAVYEERLGSERAARQAAVLALRTSRGIDWTTFEKKHGGHLSAEIKRILSKFPESLVLTDKKSARLTSRGLRVANKIWEEII
jgi:oxygen-independent coproporphyrinogen-3 oxidase